MPAESGSNASWIRIKCQLDPEQMPAGSESNASWIRIQIKLDMDLQHTAGNWMYVPATLKKKFYWLLFLILNCITLSAII